MAEQLAPHDIAALLDQAAAKEAMASPIRSPRSPAWREHYLDAIEAYERAGKPDEAARVRALLPPTSTSAAEEEAGEELQDQPQGDVDGSRPRRRRAP